MPKRFILGFTSLKEIIESVTTVFTNPGSLLYGAFGMAGFIFAPSPKAVFVLAFIMLIDWITGVIKSIILKKFNSYTFQRMILNAFVAAVLIGTAHHLSKELTLLKYLHLDSFLITAFSVTYFLSVFENLYEAKLLPENIYKYVVAALTLDNIVAKLFTKIDPNFKAPKSGLSGRSNKKKASPDNAE